ncbi:MAG: TOBE domain-containing protein, partial [Rhodobacteraceae bacterium]|nr:TOBE domain-containing protein [Paracoccaceae bacterium]
DDPIMIGFRPEAVNVFPEGQPQTAPRQNGGTIDEVVYYGDMTYYDVRLDEEDGTRSEPVRISMRNVFGRDIPCVGERVTVGWSPSSMILFR